MSIKNYIIFSSIDWETHRQIHHQLVDSIKQINGNVLFIENTGVRSPNIGDIDRILARVKKRLRSTFGFTKVDDKLTIYSPAFIPFPYNRLAIFLNRIFIGKAIRNWLKISNFNDYACLTFLPTPSINKIIRHLNPSLKIYYCADNMSRSVKKKDQIIKSEESLFAMVDIVFATSEKLFKLAKKYNDSCHLIPAGIDTNIFPPKIKPKKPKELSNFKGPIVGYIGAISSVFDQELIVSLAKKIRTFNIVLVGPIYTNVKKLRNEKNIFFIEQIEHSRVPDFLESFHITLIPYKVNEFTDSVYSCKLNEYLSMGKNVVATPTYEIKQFNIENDNVLYISESNEHFITTIKELLNVKSPSKAEVSRRVKIALSNSWDKRFESIQYLIKEKLKKNTNNSINPKDSFIEKYRKKKLRIIKYLSLVTIFSYIILYTNSIYFIGENLIIKDKPVKSDAIVVFSGDGDTDYTNLTYQNRALDAINLYKKGYANKIYLSSGRDQLISDVELIKLYLINRGVQEKDLYVLDSYPSSTLMNVRMVSNLLMQNKDKKILFLTAPYHTYRAVLTWKKQSPQINVITPDLREKIDKSFNLKRLKIIFYESLAIIHNWLNNRI